MTILEHDISDLDFPDTQAWADEMAATLLIKPHLPDIYVPPPQVVDDYLTTRATYWQQILTWPEPFPELPELDFMGRDHYCYCSPQPHAALV